MSGTVYTYYHPKKWRDHEQFQNINHEIHICATRNLKNGIKEFYLNDEEFKSIYTIKEISDALFPEWNSSEYILIQYLCLTDEISKFKIDSGEGETIVESFSKNGSLLLDTIRTLTSLKISPTDFQKIIDINHANNTAVPFSKIEMKFLEVWKRLEIKDYSYKFHRENLSRNNNINDIVEAINSWVSSNPQKKNASIPSGKKTLVLHGFYYITPEQQILLKHLENAGFRIIFFNYYDERFPATFDFTKAFITERYGWDENWNIQHTPESHMNDGKGKLFLDAYEHIKQGPVKKVKGEVVSYESFFEFLHQVILAYYPIDNKNEGDSKNKEGMTRIIATNADYMNEMLIQYYPDKFKSKKNFLSYPIGQFIVKIHEMYNKDNTFFTDDILMSTFSSGWLWNKESSNNARDYTFKLNKILPFFEGCRLIEEWKDRMQQLIYQYDNVLPLFENEGDNRAVKSMSSPFMKIGYLSLDIDDLYEINNFMGLLEDISKKLFESISSTVSINEHFGRLLNILEEHNPMNNPTNILTQEEETILIRELNINLKKINNQSEINFSYIGDALNLYLSGKLNNDEDDFIIPFIQMDGEAFKENDQKVFLTCLDEYGLPFDTFSNPWPLSDETIQALSTTHISLEYYALRNKSIKQASRYLFFMALEFVDSGLIELSWIKNLVDKKKLQPAVYLQQLGFEVRSNQKTDSDAAILSTKNLMRTICSNSDASEEKHRNQPWEELEYDEFIGQFLLCPRSFYYNCLADEYPVFLDSFTHQFLFSNIVKIIKSYTHFDDEVVIKEASELFPQWSDFKKQSLAKSSIGFALGGPNSEPTKVNKTNWVSPYWKMNSFPILTKDKRYKLFSDIENKREEIIRLLKSDNESMRSIQYGCYHNDDYKSPYCKNSDI